VAQLDPSVEKQASRVDTYVEWCMYVRRSSAMSWPTPPTPPTQTVVVDTDLPGRSSVAGKLPRRLAECDIEAAYIRELCNGAPTRIADYVARLPTRMYVTAGTAGVGQEGGLTRRCRSYRGGVVGRMPISLRFDRERERDGGGLLEILGGWVAGALHT